MAVSLLGGGRRRHRGEAKPEAASGRQGILIATAVQGRGVVQVVGIAVHHFGEAKLNRWQRPRRPESSGKANRDNQTPGVTVVPQSFAAALENPTRPGAEDGPCSKTSVDPV